MARTSTAILSTPDGTLAAIAELEQHPACEIGGFRRKRAGNEVAGVARR
jgi:hypothetical protein